MSETKTLNSFYEKNEHLISNIGDINFIDKNGEFVDLNMLRNNKPVLVLFFSEASCPPCVSDYLTIFNKIGCDYKDQVLVITNQKILRNLKLFQQNFKCLKFANQSGESVFIGDYILDQEEPAMVLINNENIISRFRRGLAKDSIDNPYFLKVKDFLEKN